MLIDRTLFSEINNNIVKLKYIFYNILVAYYREEELVKILDKIFQIIFNRIEYTIKNKNILKTFLLRIARDKKNNIYFTIISTIDIVDKNFFNYIVQLALILK